MWFYIRNWPTGFSARLVSRNARGESQGGEDAGDGDDAAHRGQRRGWIPRGGHGDFIIKNDDFHGISMDLWHQTW